MPLNKADVRHSRAMISFGWAKKDGCMAGSARMVVMIVWCSVAAFTALVEGVIYGLANAFGEETLETTLERGALPKVSLPPIQEEDEDDAESEDSQDVEDAQDEKRRMMVDGNQTEDATRVSPHILKGPENSMDASRSLLLQRVFDENYSQSHANPQDGWTHEGAEHCLPGWQDQEEAYSPAAATSNMVRKRSSESKEDAQGLWQTWRFANMQEEPTEVLPDENGWLFVVDSQRADEVCADRKAHVKMLLPGKFTVGSDDKVVHESLAGSDYKEEEGLTSCGRGSISCGGCQKKVCATVVSPRTSNFAMTMANPGPWNVMAHLRIYSMEFCGCVSREESTRVK